MLEILVLATFLLIGAAKAGTRRRRRSYIKVTKFKGSISLGTLAADTCISGALIASDVINNYLISADAYVAFRGHTAGEGPLSVGFAHGDYSTAEIEEWIEATSDFDRSDKINQERSKRKCRDIGIFSGQGTTQMLNDGKAIRVPLKFVLEAGNALNIWVYNEGSQLTTGTMVEVYGKLYHKSM